jgi:3-phytase
LEKNKAFVRMGFITLNLQFMKKAILFSGLILFLFLFLFSCRPTSSNQQQTPKIPNNADLEAREDSLELVAAYNAQAKIPNAVTPDVETRAIKAENLDDAADDPAIWVNPENPSASLIYGSNKKGGLAVYNLSGEEVAYYPIGNINNVDILYDYPMGDSTITLLGCSNRSIQSIDLFRVNPGDGALQNLAADTLAVDSSKIDDIYGFAFGRHPETNKSYAIINGKNGRMQQFEIVPAPKGKLDLKMVREVTFDSQTEGMVVDNEQGILYVGEEGRGIWKLLLAPEAGAEKTFVAGSDDANPHIRYDIEGLTLFKAEGKNYLLASSQGNFSYAVFEGSGDNAYLTSFKITDTGAIDGVEETDGLDVVSDSLSPAFPKGLLVVQDGFNYEGESLRSQNFKLVSWGKVMDIISSLKK